MVVVCLFLNFVPMCKSLFEQQFLCNTSPLYCVTLLSLCIFQRLGRVEWGVILSSLNNNFSHCLGLNQLCAFSFHYSSCANYCPFIALYAWDMQTRWHNPPRVCAVFLHSTSLWGGCWLSSSSQGLLRSPCDCLSPQAATFASMLYEITKPLGCL